MDAKIINSVNSRYIQQLDQCLLWLSEYLHLNSNLIVIGVSDPMSDKIY